MLDTAESRVTQYGVMPSAPLFARAQRKVYVVVLYVGEMTTTLESTSLISFS